MATINLIRFIFIFLSAFTVLGGLLVNCLEPYLPISIVRTYCYGKSANKGGQSSATSFEIPKRWFKHFYMFAVPFCIVILYLIIRKYLYNDPIPENVLSILDISFGSSRKPLVSAESTFLAAILFTFHCCKRLYESTCVSVYSDAKMNIIHYIAAFTHYTCTILCIIGESDGFVEGSSGSFTWYKITLVQVICACIFLTASYIQLQSNFILRNLRKDGNKTSRTEYKIPYGGLFDYVSSPLQLTEIIIYIILSIILWQSHTYHYDAIWVTINQVECALLNHWWHLKNFKNYPKHRTALIPLLF